MQYDVKGINGKVSFDKINTEDGLNIAWNATYLDKDPETSNIAIKKIGAIILKYTRVDGELLKDIAGLESMSDEANPFVYMSLVEVFMSEFSKNL